MTTTKIPFLGQFYFLCRMWGSHSGGHEWTCSACYLLHADSSTMKMEATCFQKHSLIFNGLHKFTTQKIQLFEIYFPIYAVYTLLSRHKNARQNHDIKTARRSFENVAQFRYLGKTATNQNLIQEEINRRLNSGNACYRSIHLFRAKDQVLHPYKLHLSFYVRNTAEQIMTRMTASLSRIPSNLHFVPKEIFITLWRSQVFKITDSDKKRERCVCDVSYILQPSFILQIK
jgi:hypothetical protein